MIRIYFDNVPLPDNSIVGLTQSAKLFNTNLKLGSTVCREFELKVYSESALATPNEVVIKDLVGVTETLVATLVVDSVEEDCSVYEFTLVDRMINGNKRYDYSSLVPCQLHVIVDAICAQMGVTAPTGYTGYDRNVTNYDTTKTMREIIGYVAELNAGFARIREDNVLEIVPFNDTQHTINVDECSSFTVGNQFTIGGVNWGGNKYPTDAANNVLELNEDNLFLEAADLQIIYEVLDDFIFYNIEVEDCPIADSLPGDTIVFDDGTNTYNTICEIDYTYSAEWLGGYKLDIESFAQESTDIIGTDDKIRNVKIQVDHNSNLINIQGTKIDGLEENSIHFYVDGDLGQCVVSKDGIENGQYPQAYTTFKDDGVRVYVQNQAVSEFTDEGVNIKERIVVQDWVQQRGSTNTMNFFRRI